MFDYKYTAGKQPIKVKRTQDVYRKSNTNLLEELIKKQTEDTLAVAIREQEKRIEQFIRDSAAKMGMTVEEMAECFELKYDYADPSTVNVSIEVRGDVMEKLMQAEKKVDEDDLQDMREGD